MALGILTTWLWLKTGHSPITRYISSASIAAAIEEQGQATSQISQNIHQAAGGTERVDRDMKALKKAVQKTSQSAENVQGGSKAVSEQADQLKQIVNRFLDEVAAA